MKLQLQQATEILWCQLKEFVHDSRLVDYLRVKKNLKKKVKHEQRRNSPVLDRCSIISYKKL